MAPGPGPEQPLLPETRGDREHRYLCKHRCTEGMATPNRDSGSTHPATQHIPFKKQDQQFAKKNCF